jgi:hypothetical protein
VTGSGAKLPVNTVKIDRSFLATRDAAPESMTIATTIISLADERQVRSSGVIAGLHPGGGSGVSVDDHRHGDRADREDSGGEQTTDPEGEGHDDEVETPGQDAPPVASHII